jgi:hypothetical protein
MLAGGGWATLAAVRLLSRGLDRNDPGVFVVGCIAAVVALALVSICAAGVLAWSKRHVDFLQVSGTGILYGNECWGWQDISALRLALSDKQIPLPHIKLWTRKSKNRNDAGRCLAVNTHLTLEEEAALNAKINRHLNKQLSSVASE